MITMTLMVLGGWGVLGCSGDTETDSGSAQTGDTAPPIEYYVPKSDCGATTFHDITVSGLVEQESGGLANGATIELVDNTLLPAKILASDTTANGAFSFPVNQIRSIENCWGNGRLDYRLQGTLGDTSFDQGINQPIFNSIFVDKDKVVDLSALPFVLR